MKVYEYKNCGTCKKALKWLESHDIEYKKIPIRETPPSRAELKKMLKAYNGEIKKLFNTSGQDYRSMNLKDKMATISESEALELLSTNGNLVKRPFVVSKDVFLVGFQEASWKEQLI